MTVDSDTAKYQHKLGNKSFYFCSKQCVERFKKEPAKYEKLAEAQVVERTGNAWSTPLVYRGKMYFKGRNDFVCYDAAGK